MTNQTVMATHQQAERDAWTLSQNGTGLDAHAVYKFPNPSGLMPLGHAVLVRPYIPEIKKTNSMIVIPDQVRQSMQSVDQRAVVIAVGPLAWENEGLARAKPGDKVLVTRFAGYITDQTEDGAEYRLVNDRDIFCRIDWEMET